MKRLLLLTASALLIVGLSACGHTTTATPTTVKTGTDATSAVTTTTALVPQPTATTTTTAPALISQADAKSSAFAHAGVRESQVSRLTVELDYDDDCKCWEYEIDFHAGATEYDVVIDALNGTVLMVETERENR